MIQDQRCAFLFRNQLLEAIVVYTQVFAAASQVAGPNCWVDTKVIDRLLDKSQGDLIEAS